MNLRQELRERAQEQLTELRAEVVMCAVKAIEARGCHNLNPSDVLKLAAGGRVDTLNNKLVTVLANNLETQLLEVVTDRMTEKSQ